MFTFILHFVVCIDYAVYAWLEYGRTIISVALQELIITQALI